MKVTILTICLLAFLFTFPSQTFITQVSAATITVNSAADTFTNGDGQCTLRKALTHANENFRFFTDCVVGTPGEDTIIFTSALANRTITLVTELSIKDSLIINAQSAPGLSISGNNRTRVFNISSSTVVMTGFRITGGNGVTNNFGGAGIFNNGNLTLNNMVIEGNTVSGLGGGIYTSPARRLTINGGSIRGNTANQGGAIYGEDGNTGIPITISLTNVTVSGNVAAGSGGGIYATGGTINITGGSVRGNTATNQDGGGIASTSAVVNVTNSSITNNHADGAGGDGGGIYNNFGRVTLTNSTVSGNTTQGSGGGFFAVKGLSNIIGTTISGNSARSSATTSSRRGGGGLAVVSQGTVNISNSTVSGNSSDCLCGGGGISTVDGTVTTLRNVTVANNSASAGPGGGITTERVIAYVSKTDIGNTIVADNTATTDPDVNGAIVSQGFNLVRARGSSTGYVGTDLPNGSNPMIEALGNNGGSTQTHRLIVGSAAIDAGSNALAVDRSNNAALTTDQRGSGFARLRDGNLDGAAIVDIGAFEVQTGTLPPADLTIVKSHAGNFTQRDTGKTYSITVTNSGRSATSGTVSVTDTLPAGLIATAISGTGWTCTLATLTCTRSNALAASGNYPVITLTVNVTANAPATVTNTATVSGGGETNTSNNTATDPTTINAAARYAISGTVRYGTADSGQSPAAVSGVNLNLTGSANSSAISSASGAYQFSNLLGGNYTVSPSKTGEVKGINSLDATRIQQYLVGLTTLTPNQLIAADTDGNGVVNSLDATRIQQRSVGIAAPNIIGQWKFVPANRQYNALAGNATGQDYQAVLVGEVSGNWASAASFADDLETEEETLPKQENLFETADRFEHEVAAQIDERLKQSDDLQSIDSQSETVEAGSVSLPTIAKASTGTSASTPVTIGAIPADSAIESFDFSVFYDPSVLQHVSQAGSNAGTLSADCSVLANSPQSGRVVVSGACAQAVRTGSGVLYNLMFTVIGQANQTTSVSFINPVNNTNTFQFNNKMPSAAIANGQLSVMGPTAASVSVSGKVTTNTGRGIRNVTITMTDSAGNQRQAQTTSFGYYRFDNVTAGETVTVSVKARQFKFNQSSIVRTTNESVTDADFVSEH